MKLYSQKVRIEQLENRLLKLEKRVDEAENCIFMHIPKYEDYFCHVTEKFPLRDVVYHILNHLKLKFIYIPEQERSFRLEEMLQQITPENLHNEVNTEEEK